MNSSEYKENLNFSGFESLEFSLGLENMDSSDDEPTDSSFDESMDSVNNESIVTLDNENTDSSDNESISNTVSYSGYFPGFVDASLPTINNSEPLHPAYLSTFGGTVLSDLLTNSPAAIPGIIMPENKDAIERELTPILSQLVKLYPGTDNNPDFLKLSRWFAQPHRSVDEIYYVVTELQDTVRMVMVEFFQEELDDYCFEKQFDTYVLRAAAEALAVICPVLEGKWEMLAWHLFMVLGHTRLNMDNYGPASYNLSMWIIRVIRDPILCPNPDLRVHMIHLFINLVKIDSENCDHALQSLMSACSYLDRNDEGYSQSLITGKIRYMLNTNDIQCCLHKFDIDYKSQFSLRLKDKLRNQRYLREQIVLSDVSHKYGMGFKVVTEPVEVHGIRTLLKYLSEGSLLEYKSYQRGEKHEGVWETFMGPRVLLTLIRSFKATLQEPELFDVLVESVMDLMESVVILQHSDINSCHGMSGVDELLQELSGEDWGLNKITISEEIIIRYKLRICKMRVLVKKCFLDRVPRIKELVYNNEY